MDAQTCFRTTFADLQSQLNPDDISASLYSAGLLTKEEHEDVNNSILTDQTRAKVFLCAVERAIHIDPKKFSKFLDILDKIHRYKPIVQRAREQLGLQPPMQQFSASRSVGTSAGASADASTNIASFYGSAGTFGTPSEKLGLQPPIQQSSVSPSVGASTGASVGTQSGRIRDADIARIAGELPDWQTVAGNLGMGPMDIKDIENNNRAPSDQRKAFLRNWIWKNGNAATYEKLCQVLEKLDEQGAAERIRGIAYGR